LTIEFLAGSFRLLIAAAVSVLSVIVISTKSLWHQMAVSDSKLKRLEV
jgi:hypothetical protein